MKNDTDVNIITDGDTKLQNNLHRSPTIEQPMNTNIAKREGILNTLKTSIMNLSLKGESQVEDQFDHLLREPSDILVKSKSNVNGRKSMYTDQQTMRVSGLEKMAKDNSNYR